MNEIETLKNLIFGTEKEELESVAERVEELERHLDLAHELPEAIQQSHEQNPRLTRSLQRPVLESFAHSVRETPDEVSNVLFPVIGPAIRKAIQDALRALSQQLTQAIDNSLTPRGLRWRIEAWRAGVPFGEYVLRKTLLYRVEHAYLIKRDGGLLISNVHQDTRALKDDDAVSAMLTAIQDFVKDSFADDGSSRLETARIGEHTLWVLDGPHTILACFIQGVPPAGLRDDIKQVLEEINLQHSEALESFHGDKAGLSGIDSQLERCLRLELRREETTKSNRSLIVVGAILFAILAYFLASRYLQVRKMNAYRSAVADTAGLVLVGIERRGGKVHARGLRDPLAPAAEELAARVGFDAEAFTAEFSPYQSLEPALVLRRAADTLGAPETVSLGLEDGALVVAGSASSSWKNRVERSARFIPGVSRVDFTGLDYFDPEWLEGVRRRIAAPDGVSLAFENRTLILAGEAPRAWIEQLPAAVAALELSDFDFSALAPAEHSELRRLAEDLERREILFSSGVRMLQSESQKVEALASSIAALGKAARTANLVPQIRLIGHTDQAGSRAVNEMTRINRAKTVRAALVERGIPPGWLLVESAPQGGEFGEVDLSSRKLVVKVGLIDAAGEDVLTQ